MDRYKHRELSNHVITAKREAWTSGNHGKGASGKIGRLMFREKVALKAEWNVTGPMLE